MVVLVDRVAVGGARAVRDPGAGAGAHHRLERGHQAARRRGSRSVVVLAVVDVGLAVGDDHLVALQILGDHGAQRLRVPADAVAIDGAAHIEAAQRLVRRRRGLPRAGIRLGHTVR